MTIAPGPRPDARKPAGETAEPARQGGVPLPAGPAELSHAAAVQVAMQDAVAQAGLRRLNTWWPKSLAKILAAAPPENMQSFLRATEIADMGKQPPQFYQALARNPEACRLAEEYGGLTLLKVAHLQHGAPGVQLARARADIHRVLTELDRTGAGPRRIRSGEGPRGTGRAVAEQRHHPITRSAGRAPREAERADRAGPHRPELAQLSSAGQRARPDAPAGRRRPHPRGATASR
jgi:hypothetical protein